MAKNQDHDDFGRHLLMLLILVFVCVAGVLAEPRKISELCQAPPFEEGEMARFVARIGFLKVGEGTGILRKVTAPTPELQLAGELPEQEMWQVGGRIISTKPVSFFYKVDDSIAVWMQQESLLPHRQELRVDETNERGVRRIIYDHDGGIAHFWRDRTFYRRNKKREKVTIREDKLVPGSFEPLSLFFYLRCVEASEGDEFEIPLLENGKNRTVKIYVEKIEKIDTPLGEKEALRARIEVYFEGKLANERPFKAWVSNDERRIPLRFVADLKFANLKGVLVGYRRNFAAAVEGSLDPDFVAGPSPKPLVAEGVFADPAPPISDSAQQPSQASKGDGALHQGPPTRREEAPTLPRTESR